MTPVPVVERIELFPVPDHAFPGGPEFRTWLAANYDAEAVDHALTIVIGLTRHSTEGLLSVLRERGFEVVRALGAVWHLRSQTPEGVLETYLTHEIDNGVVVFYTNFRKTEAEEVPRIKDFLYGDSKSYPIFIRPAILQQVLDELSDRHSDMQIVDFTAARNPGSKVAARLRPDVRRTFSYWGFDGRETLRELSYQYGVLPRRVVVEIPGLSKFGVDSRGFFTLSRGSLDILLRIMGQSVDESRKAMRAFDGTAFQVFSVQTAHKAFGIPVSTPIRIVLQRGLAYSEVADVKSNLDDYGYTILGFEADEGSLFLSSDLLSRSGHRFRVKADEKSIRMLPCGEPNFAAFMEFYQFVLNRVDPEAELAT